MSPPSVLFQMPLPGPPERIFQGWRVWSQNAAYRMRGLVGSMLRSLAPASSSTKSTFSQLFPPSSER